MRKTKMKRVDELLREFISELLVMKVQDPRIGLVSVTGVKTSPEFDTARVFFSVLGDEDARARALAGLKSAAPFLQGEIGKSLRLRRVPKLRFIYDDSIERGFRIEKTLRGLENGPAPTPEGESDEEDR